MFQQDSIQVPVLGIVENMSYFTPEQLPENKYYIFGRDGAKYLAEDIDVPFLGDLPLVQGLRKQEMLVGQLYCKVERSKMHLQVSHNHLLRKLCSETKNYPQQKL
ncbi:MAG: hypothetical protein CM15mP83_5270 [Flavobacteriaceae bacterium]|nr:MAG: hypothetical protein CM15mP83_5270 [Flavobacteriaceae bacterium]